MSFGLLCLYTAIMNDSDYKSLILIRIAKSDAGDSIEVGQPVSEKPGRTNRLGESRPDFLHFEAKSVSFYEKSGKYGPIYTAFALGARGGSL